MQINFSKYWQIGEINYLLLVVYLDPRYKLDYIDFCYTRICGQERSEDILQHLKDIINKLFGYYSTFYPFISDGNSSGSISSNLPSEITTPIEAGVVEDDWVDEFRLKIRKKQR